MSIRLLKHSEIDKEKWDDCIQKSSNHIIFSESIFLDCVGKHWCGIVEGDYKTVMPVPVINKLGISYLSQPIFSRALYIHSNDGFSAHDLYQELFTHFSRFDIQVDQEPSIVPRGTIQDKRYYQAICTLRDTTDLTKLYSENHKRNIRKAMKTGLQVCDSNARTVIEIFSNSKYSLIKELKKDHLSILGNLMTRLSNVNKADFIEVRNNDNQCIAAACFLKSYDRIIYLKGGSTAEGRISGAMHLLMDHALNTYKKDYSIFDFGGSSISGISRFFKGFGADDFVYLRLRSKSILQYLKDIT